MKLGETMLKKISKKYEPDTMVHLRYKGYDMALKTDAGSGALEQSFDVSPLPARDGLQWLRAKPRSADAGFARVDIGFNDNLPARIELLDAFGQTTRVDLSGIVANAATHPRDFQFQAPQGVDVVRM